jgi:hypothetical protein
VHEQFTCYNLPLKHVLSEEQLTSLRIFEQLHQQYLSSPNKSDLMLKRVYPLETYALFGAEGEQWVAMATINHNRTTREIGQIL